MKTCLIAPIPDLDRFVGSHFKCHLLLDHLFEIPMWGTVYRDFYARRKRAGDFITIDNGAKEHDRGSGLAQLLARAREVQADEVVVSDIRFKGRESLALSELEMSQLTHGLRDAYALARRPRLMIVPHGETIIDWRNCLYALERIADRVLHEVEGPGYTIGVPYAYDHVFVGGYISLVEEAVNDVGAKNVHLLGWPRRLQTLLDITNAWPDIRSIDSSRPIVYGQRKLLAKNGEYPGRSDDYFTAPTPWDCELHVKRNIDTFRSFANDH